MKLLIALPLLLAAAAQADDAALRRCRALADAGARLACYDALPMGATPAATAAPQAPRPVAAPAVAPASAFGLARPADTVQEVVSRIEGRFEGWQSGTRLRLANGQLWQVIDGSSASYELRDPKVTVRRAAMGSFLLDIEGAMIMPRVRRVE